jgi:hypothetical protein
MRLDQLPPASVLWLIFCFVPCGCAAQPTTFRPVDQTPPVRAYVAVADRAAERVIEDWNTSPAAAQYFASTKQAPRTLALADYRRMVSMGCVQENSRRIGGGNYRPVLTVEYQLIHGIGILGHPSHFSIWVYMDTTQAKLFGGE